MLILALYLLTLVPTYTKINKSTPFAENNAINKLSLYARTSITLDQDHCHRPLNEHSSVFLSLLKQLWCPLPSLHQNPCTLGQVLLNNYKFIGTIDYVCLPFYLRYGFKNLDTLNKRVFWNLEGYYIQFLEFTGHPHITFVPLDIVSVP